MFDVRAKTTISQLFDNEMTFRFDCAKATYCGVVKGVFKKRDDGLCTADDVAKNWPTWHANCIKIRDVILMVFDVIPTGYHVILVPYEDVINWPTTS